MATEAITPKGEVSVIPATELPGLQSALAELERECSALPALREKIKSFEVKDAVSYAELGQYVAQAVALKKVPDFKLGSFLQMARRVVDWLRTEQNKHANAAEEIITMGKGKMAEYKRQEVLAAQAEERRINEQRRKAAEAKAEEERKEREKEIAKQVKAGEIKKREAEQLRKQADAQAEEAKNDVQQVTVRPSVPTVSGVRMQTNWKFKIVNDSLIHARFRMPDEVAIGQEVRRLKDKQKAEEQIPGIEVWSE